MNPPIALAANMRAVEEAAWLAHFAALMPGERVVPLRELTPAERAAAEIAVVAKPDAAQLEQLPNLRWVHSLWVGVETTVPALRHRGLPIVRMVDPRIKETMAEAVLAWVHYLQRDMPRYASQQRAHLWQPQLYRRPETMTVGILGLGELGRAAAEILHAARFRLAGWARRPQALDGVETFHGPDGLAPMLAGCDIVLCLLPLTAATRGLLDADVFARMKPGAGFINFGRGPVAVEADLHAALDTGRVGHAVLDVFDTEPLPEAHWMWDHPSVTVLPHITAPTDPETAAQVIAEAVAAYRRSGRPPEGVDLDAGY